MRTITLADHTFPACSLVCPPFGDDDSEIEEQRTLGRTPSGPNDRSVHIPAENGLLFQVEPWHLEPRTFSVIIHSPSCFLSHSGSERPLWLPTYVHLVDGALVEAHPSNRAPGGVWWWRGAEPEWCVEFIDRLSRLPFKIGDGPRVKLVDLAVPPRESGGHE